MEAIQEASTKALDEVRNEVALDLAREERSPALARTYAEKLIGVLNGSLDELAAAELLAEHQLSIQESGDFNGESRSVPKLGGTTAEAVSAAFVLDEVGAVTAAPIEIPVGFVVMRLKDKKEPTDGEFDNRKGDIKSKLQRSRRSQIVEAWKADLKSTALIRVVPGV